MLAIHAKAQSKSPFCATRAKAGWKPSAVEVTVLGMFGMTHSFVSGARNEAAQGHQGHSMDKLGEAESADRR